MGQPGTRQMSVSVTLFWVHILWSEILSRCRIHKAWCPTFSTCSHYAGSPSWQSVSRPSTLSPQCSQSCDCVHRWVPGNWPLWLHRGSAEWWCHSALLLVSSHECGRHGAAVILNQGLRSSARLAEQLRAEQETDAPIYSMQGGLCCWGYIGHSWFRNHTWRSTALTWLGLGQPGHGPHSIHEASSELLDPSATPTGLSNPSI